jgi:hypothetical protein
MRWDAVKLTGLVTLSQITPAQHSKCGGLPKQPGPQSIKNRPGKRTVAFRQSDISRAVKGAQAAGISVARIEIDATGTIVITSGSPQESAPTDAYSAWKEKRHARPTQRH